MALPTARGTTILQAIPPIVASHSTQMPSGHNKHPNAEPRAGSPHLLLHVRSDTSIGRNLNSLIATFYHSLRRQHGSRPDPNVVGPGSISADNTMAGKGVPLRYRCPFVLARWSPLLGLRGRPRGVASRLPRATSCPDAQAAPTLVHLAEVPRQPVSASGTQLSKMTRAQGPQRHTLEAAGVSAG
jgi:hypothetical protein